ncbi:MAG: response regulator transcription factor, partial [Gammaproteobacteria bacterium]|nr:response regulator transcription factor [Gammaproteobacteria bacterium]
MFAQNSPVLLLVEDDARLSALMQEYLQQEGFRVYVEGRGDTAARRIPAEQPDLVVLDVMLPGLDGMSVCRQVRHAYDKPILMLTARDEDIDHVLGLELGADDYVVKPVKPRVLLARIHNLLRRQEKQMTQASLRLCFGDLCIDMQSRSVSLADQTLTLTTQEFDLLYLLASQAGTILSRDAILNGLSG